jgi:hypothetical protein
MYLVMIAWMYVVLMMTVAEATSSTGTVQGALVTLMFYGALPLAIVMYLLNTPVRRRARRAALQRPAATGATAPTRRSAEAVDPDHGRHAAGDTITPVRKEP